MHLLVTFGLNRRLEKKLCLKNPVSISALNYGSVWTDPTPLSWVHYPCHQLNCCCWWTSVWGPWRTRRLWGWPGCRSDQGPSRDRPRTRSRWSISSELFEILSSYPPMFAVQIQSNFGMLEQMKWGHQNKYTIKLWPIYHDRTRRRPYNVSIICKKKIVMHMCNSLFLVYVMSCIFYFSISLSFVGLLWFRWKLQNG